MGLFDCLPCCGADEERTGPVIVTMNDHEANKEHKYPSNFISTAKYSIITFIPLNLFFQFKRISNFYFLLNMIVSLIPGVSPVSPATAIVPLIFVVGVAMIKDGYEDYQRHQADNQANSICAHVIRSRSYTGPRKEFAEGDHHPAERPECAATDEYMLVDVESKDVQVGDIINVRLGEEFRADIILLSSSIVESQAFIDTCNLDGETNLKNKKAIEPTWGLDSIENITKHKVVLTTSQPDPGLLSWGGVLTVDGEETAVGLDQFLYRSSVLRNTDSIWGIVAFAGVDTKMFRNLQTKPPKSSNLDVKLNYLIAAVLIVQQILLIIMSSLAVAFNSTNLPDMWYIEAVETDSGFVLWIYRYLSYFILMSYLIPISLFVTIELCKVSQARLMAWDVGMHEFMHGKWHGCIPNTSNLNEELSRVKFIFSDKTGTLTENIMRYKQGDILGSPVYADDMEISLKYIASPSSAEEKAKAVLYFQALALCHTIQPFPDPDNPNELQYDGSSPDEVALVATAKNHGISLIERSTRSMTLNVLGETVKFEILATLEFTPDRKMMSMIIKDPRTGQLTLYTKGADSFVMPHLAKNAANQKNLPPCLDALKDMALEGLRTLLVCTKDITEEEFQAWNLRFIEAGKTLGAGRSEVVDGVCLQMEHDMNLCGATAIEDKLQDQVPETLQYFLAAGVIVWMLTGDKRETAVTIAATSSLANPQEDYIDHIDIGDLDMKTEEEKCKALVGQQLATVEQHINAGDKHCTFVVDGPALNVCMAHHFDLFLELSQKVNSAVCCRLTPLQKARVVKMFQEATGLTALAIGDGANDVSMIQEGKVGIGIVGLEGAQAALAADYAIPRFKHLRRLCCVHGRYALVRNAICTLVSFYKNIVLSLTQFYFAFSAGFSGQTLYDGWLLSFYNLAFTSMPPLFMGIFEKDLEEQALEDNPQLYPPLANGAYFDTKTILRWFIEAILHSVILYFFMWNFMLQIDLGEKRMDGLMFGTCLISCMIFLALGKMCLHMRYWTAVEGLGIFISLVFFLSAVLMYAGIPNLFGDTTFHKTIFILFAEPKYWFFMILFVIGLLFPIDMGILFAQKTICPTQRDEVEEEYAVMG